MEKRPQILIFTRKEENIIKACLDYAWHRVTKHKNTGIESINKELLDELRRKF